MKNIPYRKLLNQGTRITLGLLSEDKAAKQAEVLKLVGHLISRWGGYMEGKLYYLIPGGLVDTPS